MQGFKLQERSSTYHVKVPSPTYNVTKDVFFEDTQAFGVEIKDGSLIFYQANSEAVLIYAPGTWLGLTKD